MMAESGLDDSDLGLGGNNSCSDNKNGSRTHANGRERTRRVSRYIYFQRLLGTTKHSSLFLVVRSRLSKINPIFGGYWESLKLRLYFRRPSSG